MKIGARLWRHFNLTIPRCIDGQWIRVPVMAGHKPGLTGERFLLDILKFYLPKVAGAVVDVGANLGQTLCKVKLADARRRYIGFEPNAACHAYLDELIRVNGWNDVSILPCGISEQTSILDLHISSDNATDSRGTLFPDIREGPRRTKSVALFEYDDIAVVREERIAFLKIDVEGAELEVLRGMTTALQRDRPIMAIELMPLRALQHQHQRTLELLFSLGYDVFEIEKSHDKRWTGLRSVSGYEFPDDPNVSDYLGVPRSMAS